MKHPGRRRSWNNLRPHTLPLTLVGTAIVWSGWFGFNAGSALKSSPLNVGAFVIGKVVGWVTGGLRASAEDEENGMDVTEHGEVGYSGESAGAPAYAGMD